MSDNDEFCYSKHATTDDYVLPLRVCSVHGFSYVLDSVDVDWDTNDLCEHGGILHPLPDSLGQVHLQGARLWWEVILLDGMSLVHVDHDEENTTAGVLVHEGLELLKPRHERRSRAAPKVEDNRVSPRLLHEVRQHHLTLCLKFDDGEVGVRLS